MEGGQSGDRGRRRRVSPDGRQLIDRAAKSSEAKAALPSGHVRGIGTSFAPHNDRPEVDGACPGTPGRSRAKPPDHP